MTISQCENFTSQLKPIVIRSEEMNGVKWREVPFEIMLQCDGEVKCECWLLSNSINNYGVDLRVPMFFNEFLKQIGSHLTSMNCQSLFKQAKWYVIDDGIQPDFFMEG